MDRRSFPGFSLSLPKEWQNRTDEGSTTFSFDREEGVGSLQFSVGILQGGERPEVSLQDLKGLAMDFGERRGLEVGSDWLSQEGSLMVAGVSYRMQGRFLRVWYLSDGDSVALATYNCRWEDLGLEAKLCEDYVTTLRFEE